MGWSTAQVTLGYSLMMVVYAVTAYFSGMILDKWGTKPVYAIAAVFGHGDPFQGRRAVRTEAEFVCHPAPGVAQAGKTPVDR